MSYSRITHYTLLLPLLQYTLQMAQDVYLSSSPDLLQLWDNRCLAIWNTFAFWFNSN